MNKIEYELRTRFIKDNNLPIPVIEDPYFEYFLDLYESDYKSRTSWTSLQKEIEDNFSGNPGVWLSHFYQIRDRVIEDILKSPGYVRFLEDSCLEGIHKETPGEIKRTLYSGENVGRNFLSVDLKTANFQALRWYDGEIFLGENTYEEFLGHYDITPSFLRSKYTRQVIFGKLNVSRQLWIEKFLTWRISEILSPLFPESFSLFSRMTDEVIWIIPDNYTASGELEKKGVEVIKRLLGIDVKVEVFKLGMIQKFTSTGSSITGITKNYIYPMEKPSELKDTPKTYFAQIWKAWKGMEVNPEYDLVLLHDGELAHFDRALR